MVSTILNLLVKINVIHTYLIHPRKSRVGRDPHTSQVTNNLRSDVVSNLASMRMTFLVCSSSQSNWSALMVFNFSVPSANS